MSAHPSESEVRPEPVPRLLYDELEAAQALNVSKPTFRNWVSAGVIRPVRLPFDCRRRLYRVSDIEAFAASLEPSHVPAG